MPSTALLPALRPLLLAAAVAGALPAQASSEPFLGELMLFSGDFCPRYWLPADGRLLSVSAYETLFALIGSTYGGDGTINFALPDLRGRAPIGAGQGPGLNSMAVGQRGGSETATLNAQNLPMHSHALAASTQPATHATPAPGQVLGKAQNAGVYASNSGATVALAPTGVAGSPAPAPFSIRDPYLTMQWCIAVDGAFPSRN
ncbi:tail fiber protein [Melaminivora jejuensis]|uniref:phage tail protein n=1 Tax=Melaminivora jejuensis TaxID=1267217 RepID=UPI001ADF71A1|nr:tail fiber protein [Melaminivora jejuensis]UHJ66462.1 tail fiber protein [Melaminivora jejuensis]